MTTSEAVNGQNTYTGTVHRAHYDGRHLVQNCGFYGNAYAGQRSSLAETTAKVTCKRCAANQASDRKSATRSAGTGNGSTAWGVFDAAGTLLTYRTTKREATAAADRIGDGATVGRV